MGPDVAEEAAVGNSPTRVGHHMVDIDADGTQIRVHVSSGKRTGDAGIVVIHEKRGVDVHTRHIADRLAEAGYTVFVPDLLSRYGRSRHGSVPTARGIPSEWHVDDVLAVCDRIVDRYRLDVLGCLGYSFGGALAAQLATRCPSVRALVTYYAHPSAPEWERLEVPVLAIYGETDDQLERVGAARDALSHDPSPVMVQRFPGPRAFENPHRPDRYREESAREAWRLTVDWFDRHLAPGRAAAATSDESR